MMRHGATMAMLGAVLALSGCATTGAVGGNRTELTDCTHYSGWCREIRTAAVQSYAYAQIAANSYDDKQDRPFDLGPDFTRLEARPSDGRGFAYAVYDHHPGGQRKAIVLAFRGTEQTFSDWIIGNLLGLQNTRGMREFQRLRAQYGPDIPIVVTGHSLGGAIATHVSLRQDSAPAFVFNTSPRFSKDGPPARNDRLSVVEYGEWLKAARVFGREPTQRYISIGCTPGFNVFRQHSIVRLARCLTRIAAYEGEADGGARESMRRNGIGVRGAAPK